MFCPAYNTTKLPSRNEGKLKSYDSCTDVRAWCHDSGQRNSYLREWIRWDMPVCLLPVGAVARFLRVMTKKRWTNASPRCYPECRAKVLLDSIHTSCHAIRQCLRTEGEFHKYFEDEEFETGHWPCERCLEILKNIKLFWKILLEKVLNKTVPTSEDFDRSRSESISQVAKDWQGDIVKQALRVKNHTLSLSNHFDLGVKESKNNTKIINNIHSDDHEYQLSKRDKKYRHKATSTDFNNTIYKVKPVETVCKSTSAFAQKKDVSCNTSSTKTMILNKDYINRLQKKTNMQSDEIKRLQNENISLKLKLKKSPACTYNAIPDNNTILKPYEDCCEEGAELLKDIASEMIITLKNCQNKDFRHVSILKVLHKSNGICANENMNYQFNKINPLEVLTRVHDTFGAIVKREMSIVNENKDSVVNDINSSFHQLGDRESIPFCPNANSATTTTSNFDLFKTEYTFTRQYLFNLRLCRNIETKVKDIVNIPF